MPAPATIPDLIELIRKSKLLDPARLDAYLVTHPGPYAAPVDLCNRLLADGLLTPFHAEQLLRGKYKGFFLGKYRVLDRIGFGGMGQVFLAEHASMKRRAAIKVLPPDRAANEYSRERFLREARAAGQFDHPNLVRAFDVDQDGEVIFLVMEFVDGVSFHDLVCRFGPLTPARAGYYLWQAACGLAYMHERGLIHRDIKPANLLVDRQGVVKILDLGLVRAEGDDDNLTRGEGVKILGTADYLAPEQAIDCSNVDIRADIYGLGATAYFLLTGKPPFDGERVAQKLIAHQTKVPTPVHALRPEVPRELSAVVAKMLAKRPADRHQTPSELALALDEWARTPPPPPTEQEIPATVGTAVRGPGSVNLGFPGVRPPGSSSSSSGSVVRCGLESHLRATPRPAPLPHRQPPEPITLTPPAAKPTLRPAAAPTPPPAAAPFPAQVSALEPEPQPQRFCGTTTHPPLLPAADSHGKAVPGVESQPAPPVRRYPAPRRRAPRPPAPPAPAERRPERVRHRVSMALAFGLTLAVAAWDVAVLTGAMEGPPAQSQAPAERDGYGLRGGPAPAATGP